VMPTGQGAAMARTAPGARPAPRKEAERHRLTSYHGVSLGGGRPQPRPGRTARALCFAHREQNRKPVLLMLAEEQQNDGAAVARGRGPALILVAVELPSGRVSEEVRLPAARAVEGAFLSSLNLGADGTLVVAGGGGAAQVYELVCDQLAGTRPALRLVVDAGASLSPRSDLELTASVALGPHGLHGEGCYYLVALGTRAGRIMGLCFTRRRGSGLWRASRDPAPFRMPEDSGAPILALASSLTGLLAAARGVDDPLERRVVGRCCSLAADGQVLCWTHQPSTGYTYQHVTAQLDGCLPQRPAAGGGLRVRHGGA